MKLIHKNDGFAVLSAAGRVFKDRHAGVRIVMKNDGYWYLTGHSNAIGTRASALVYLAKKKGNLKVVTREFEHRNTSTRIKMIHSSEGICFLSGLAGSFNGGGRQKWIELGDDGYWYLSGEGGRRGKGIHVC